MFLLYSLVFSFGALLAAPVYLWRGRGKSLGAGYWRERLGFLPPSFQQSQQGAVWVHAVSVGETLAAAKLVRELEKQFPERKIFLSHVTPAGREAGEKRLPSVAGRFFLPFDWTPCVRRVIERIRPALLVIVETELWPNLLRLTHKSGARIVLVNARLSDRSFRRYRPFRAFMRRVLEHVDTVCAQTLRDAERFERLGVSRGRVVVTGNLKFDVEPPKVPAAARLGAALHSAGRCPVIVAASTMPGEEMLLLESWDKIRRRYPKALLVVAPRHPTRFDGVAQLLAGHCKSLTRRTSLDLNESTWTPRLESTEIFLLDTIGELASIYELADLVFMGGSLVPTGGHNILEPAFWGKAILFGPHMENFRDVAQLFVSAGASVQVEGPEELTRLVLGLLGDEPRRRQLGEKAKRVLEQASGATERVLEHIRVLLAEEMPVRASA